MASFDPTQAWSFLISLDNDLFFFLRIALAGLKYAIGTADFTMILWVAAYIGAVFGQLRAMTFAALMYFSFSNHHSKLAG